MLNFEGVEYKYNLNLDHTEPPFKYGHFGVVQFQWGLCPHNLLGCVRSGGASLDLFAGHILD